MESAIQLNEAKKDYPREMHTTEHILNQTMVRMFGCPRSMNAHIEKKKSKCDYTLEQAPTEDQISALIAQVNAVIAQKLDVTEELMSRQAAAELVDLTKLSSEAGDTLRVVRVGNYDACACIGQHVSNTAEIGTFHIISHDYENGKWRVRFKLI